MFLYTTLHPPLQEAVCGLGVCLGSALPNMRCEGTADGNSEWTPETGSPAPAPAPAPAPSHVPAPAPPAAE